MHRLVLLSVCFLLDVLFVLVSVVPVSLAAEVESYRSHGATHNCNQDAENRGPEYRNQTG